MVSTAKFRQRFHPFLALLVGGIAVLSTFAILYANAYQAAKRSVAAYSLERQVAELLSGTAKAKKQVSLADRIQGYRSEAEVAACVYKIKSLVNTAAGKVPSQLSAETRRLLLQDKNCDFFEPRVSDLIHSFTYLKSGLVVGTMALLLTSIWSWVATFPHVGWRRLALAVGLVAGALVWLVVWWSNEYEFHIGAIVVVVSATCVVVGLLVGYKAFKWIKHGFDAAGKGEA